MDKLANILIKSAYKIESSRCYHRFRKCLYNILINNGSVAKKYFDLTMIFLVLSTVAILVYEVKHTLPEWVNYYEYFAVFIFIIEWIGRFIVSFESHKQIIKDYEEAQFLNLEYKPIESIKTITKEKLKYVFSLASIVDLLAILPSYRPLRVLRIFLLFRLFKLLRYTTSLNQFVKVFLEKKYELLLLLSLYLLMIFFSSTVLYIYEGDGLNDKITSFYDAIYWGFITVSTIGYGDITPVSDAGRAVVLILILTGYTLIAFFTSIVTSTITQKLDTIKEASALSQVNKMKNFILICGYGKVGQTLAKNLKKQKYDILIIDENDEAAKMAELDGFSVIKDDASKIDILQKIILDQDIKNIIVVNDSDTMNLSIILAVRSIDQQIPIIARCESLKNKQKLHLAGANEVMHINEAVTLEALGYVGSPVAFEAIDEILIDQKGALMDVIEVFENSYFINKKISQIEFNKFNINFIGIYRDDKFLFNPKKDEFIIHSRDSIVIVGYEKSINEFKTYIQAHKIKLFG